MFEFFSWARKGEYRDDHDLNEFGIEVTPVPMTAGEQVTIRYSGLLAQNGADKLVLHTGFGGNQAWFDVKDVSMQKVGANTWEAKLPLTSDSRLNFCFKDSAENWDNNNGKNWSYEIHNGQVS